MTAAVQKIGELQRWMLAAVTDPASAREQEVQRAILPSQQQSAEERLAVYQHAYVARLLEVLREQFPCTRFAAGEEVFGQLALGYLQAHPPYSYTLARLADHFAEHLETTRPADWGGFLVELAKFEQAIDRIFDGPGPERMSMREATFLRQEPLTENARVGAATNCNVNAEADTGRMPVAPESLKLSFVPGFELHAFDYPVSAFYTAWKAGEEPAWPEVEFQFVALFRRDYIVRRYELSRVQFELLKNLQSGKSLGESLAVAADSWPDISLDQLALDVHEWFAQWTAGGFFVAGEQTRT